MAELLFEFPPLVGPDYDLVFGGGEVEAPVIVPPPTYNLRFYQQPLVGPNYALLFGEVDEGAPVGLIPVRLVGQLPAPSFAASIETTTNVTITGLLPRPVVDVHIATFTDVTITGTLPALRADISIATITDVTVTGKLADPLFDATVKPITYVTLTGLLAAPSFTAAALYLSNTSRPLVNRSAVPWEVSRTKEVGAQHRSQSPIAAPSGRETKFSPGAPIPAGATQPLSGAIKTPTARNTGMQQAMRQSFEAPVTSQDGSRALRPSQDSGYQQAVRASFRSSFFSQDGIRTERKAAAGRWQIGRRQSFVHVGDSSVAVAFLFGRTTPFQDAIVPPPGMYIKPIIAPPRENCYLIPLGSATNLSLGDVVGAGNGLIYVCEQHDGGGDGGEGEVVNTVIVPVQRVYMVLNEASLRRVDGNLPIPTLAMSLNLDFDSWTWGFSATLPGQAESLIEPDLFGNPVEVEALINGVPYRMLIESISRERTFGRKSLRVGGRGLSALLDAPYSPNFTYTNTLELSAQQLIADVLSDNGVPLPWDINFQLEDWLVPANVFSNQGSYMSALLKIAAAAGGYVQPHASLKQLFFKPKYPFAPWKWATDVTPHYVLPADVTTRESISYVDKPRYNRVYVSGVNEGVLGMVTREGTAGELLAPLVTDPLVTQAVVARQRGTAILSDVGRQANVSIRLPVLSQTGIIVPGKFIDYTDTGITRRGIVRSVQVDVGSPAVFQTIGVETHVNPL